MESFLLGVLLAPVFFVLGMCLAILTGIILMGIGYGLIIMLINISIWIQVDVWEHGIKPFVKRK